MIRTLLYIFSLAFFLLIIAPAMVLFSTLIYLLCTLKKYLSN